MITRHELRKLIEPLSHHHCLYSTLSGAEFRWSDSIPFARVGVKGRTVQVELNRAVWESANDYFKLFVLVHEALHFISGHLWPETIEYVAGTKFHLLSKYERMALAYAVDVVVNNIVTEHLHLDRHVIDPDEKFIWAQTVFRKLVGDEVEPWRTIRMTASYRTYADAMTQTIEVRRRMCAESGRLGLDAYFSIFCQIFETYEPKNLSEEVERHAKEMGESKAGGNKQSDGHGESPEDRAWVADKIKKDRKFDRSVKQMFKDAQDPKTVLKVKRLMAAVSHGHEGGEGHKVMDLNDPVKSTRMWADVIRKWDLVAQHAGGLGTDWTNSRMAHSLLPKNLILPRLKAPSPDFKRTKVAVFLDFSGSCRNLSMRFLRLALTIPKTRFDVRLFQFATRTVELDKWSIADLMGDPRSLAGSSTRFGPIMDVVEKDAEMKAVFVITDGEAPPIYPKEGRRWSWFVANTPDFIDGKMGWVGDNGGSIIRVIDMGGRAQ